MSLRELKIELTDQCLLNCVHCSTGAHLSLNSFLSRNSFKKIIDQALALGCRKVYFSGGEPFLHPDLNLFLKILSEKGVCNKIYTSGSNPNNPSNSFSNEIIKASNLYGLSHLVFSLYSARPSIHDSITNIKGSLDATVKSMKTAIKLNIETEVHFVALRGIINELKLLSDFVESLGVNKISILRFVPQGRGKVFEHGLTPTVNDFEALKKTIIKLRENKPNITFRLGSPFNFLLLGPPTPCTTGADRMIIDAEGLAYPCDALKQVKMANQKNCVYNRSLQQILDDAPLFQLVKNIKLPNSCKGCPELRVCEGGCLAQRLLTDEKTSVIPDPGCLRVSGGKSHVLTKPNRQQEKTLSGASL